MTDLVSSSKTKAWLLKQFASPYVTFIVFSVLKDQQFFMVSIGKYLGQFVSFKAKNTNFKIENLLFSFIGSYFKCSIASVICTYLFRT